MRDDNNNDRLFDVFYGKDYLRLVCGASRLRTSTQGISFWVGEYVVRLRKDVGEKNLCPYTLSISDRKTQHSLFYSSTLSARGKDSFLSLHRTYFGTMTNQQLSWSDTLRYCKMCRKSVVAQELYHKARRGRKLSQKEIRLIEGYAGRMVELVGTDSVEVEVGGGELKNLSVHLPPELLLQSESAEVVKRGEWLVDTVTGCVVGRCGRTLTLVPNPIVLVNDLAREIRKSVLGCRGVRGKTVNRVPSPHP